MYLQFLTCQCSMFSTIPKYERCRCNPKCVPFFDCLKSPEIFPRIRLFAFNFRGILLNVCICRYLSNPLAMKRPKAFQSHGTEVRFSSPSSCEQSSVSVCTMYKSSYRDNKDTIEDLLFFIYIYTQFNLEWLFQSTLLTLLFNLVLSLTFHCCRKVKNHDHGMAT